MPREAHSFALPLSLHVFAFGALQSTEHLKPTPAANPQSSLPDLPAPPKHARFPVPRWLPAILRATYCSVMYKSAAPPATQLRPGSPPSKRCVHDRKTVAPPSARLSNRTPAFPQILASASSPDDGPDATPIPDNARAQLSDVFPGILPASTPWRTAAKRAPPASSSRGSTETLP